MENKGLSWWDRVFIAVIAVFCFCLVLYMAFGGEKIGAFLACEVTIAWVQALGTLLALAVAVGIAWWESHQRRLDAKARAAQLVRGKIMLLEQLMRKLDSLHSLHANTARMDITALRREYDGLKYYCREVQQIDIGELPNLECMRLFTFVKQITVETTEHIERCGDTDWLGEDDVKQLGIASSIIKQLVRRLSDQAARIGT